MEAFGAAAWEWLQRHGLWGVSLFMMAESGGWPVPTILGFLVAEGLVRGGACSYVAAWAWIVGGHMAGATLTYLLGRSGDSALARYFSHKPGVVAAHQQMQRWFAKYGAMAILLGRLIGQVRPWASFVAGLARVPWGRFCLWTFIGTVIFTAVTMGATALGFQYWQAHRQWGVPIAVGLLLLFYGLPLYKGLQHFRERRRRRIEPPAAIPACEADDTKVL